MKIASIYDRTARSLRIKFQTRLTFLLRVIEGTNHAPSSLFSRSETDLENPPGSEAAAYAL